MLPVISVIVPVYNVEAYLDQCVQSLLAQTYPNCEILLIDDGSSDSSGQMCDQYAKEAENVKVYHRKNEGPSGARNYGVKCAAGEYIAFVDSDDCVTPDYVEYLYALIVQFNSNIAGASLSRRNHYGQKSFERYSKEERVCVSTGEALKKMCYADGVGVSPCAKLYRRDLLEAFPYPLGCLYEDVDTTYKIIAACNKMAIGTKVIYYYIQRDGSIIHRPLDESQFYGIVAATNLYKTMEANFPEAAQAAKVRCAMKAVEYMPCVLDDSKNGKVYYARVKSFLAPYFWDTLKDKRASKGLKLRCIATMAGYSPAKLLWKLGEFVKAIKQNNESV